ncbi:MAG: hypothetical protein JNK73_13190 [Bacteroidia bacterium]|nr:hypothetical protein [Bacteroidia bacterium]
MSKNINKQIAEAFIASPKEDKLLVTSDGNCFSEKNKSYAELHARRNDQKVREVTREEFQSEIEVLQTKKEEAVAAEADNKAKEELAARAKAVGLPEDASEKEIKAAEKKALKGE